MGEQSQPTHPGINDLHQYSLMQAIAERRTRRVARGVSIEAGPLSHSSTNAPAPLSELEEAILIGSLGVTGVSTHDGPLEKKDGRELGTPFLNAIAYSASSADNSQATSFFMINDDGIWLLEYPKGRTALEFLQDLPPNWSDWTEADWVGMGRVVKCRLSERRLSFPREYPYYLGWNAQMSNQPGTTLFFPVVGLYLAVH